MGRVAASTDPNPVIPLTALHTEYLGLLNAPQEARLRRAKQLDGDALATLFARTVAELQPFEAREPNPGDWLPFYPLDRVALNKRKDIGTTRIARRLDDAGRRLCNTGDPEVRFRYVDREIAPLRRPGARFGPGRLSGKTSRSAPRLDLLLQADDGTPVVGEVKVAHDKDPFFGLIQALMHTAHLVTRHQADRLACVKLRRRFDPGAQPPFDVYLVLERFDPKRGKYRPWLYERAREIATAIVEESALNDWVRQIACLDATVEGEQVSFQCLWRTH